MISLPVINTQATNTLDLLVVDDSELTLEIVSWSLARADISYQLCRGAKEALQAMSQSIPRVLIVDYYMPVTDGMELLERFRQLPKYDTCAIYLCSSVKLLPDQYDFLSEIGAQIIEKDVLCDNSSLLNLVQSCISVSNT